jgi:hypothetical protein
MTLRASDAKLEQFLGVLNNEIPVFGMNLSQGTQLLTLLHHCDQLIVVQLEDVFVRHKRFERIDPVFCSEFFHFTSDLISPPSDSNVETVIAANFIVSPTPPFVIGFN